MAEREITFIVARARDGTIAKDGDVPWKISRDLKRFKRLTMGMPMIMGRKTFESLPGHLPNRHHIVISHNQYVGDEPDVTFTRSIDEALAAAKKLTGKYGDEVFIVGGGEIYKQTMNIVDRIYLTVIDQEFEGDAKYPEFSEKDFLLTEENPRPGPPPFKFLTYVRKQRS